MEILQRLLEVLHHGSALKFLVCLEHHGTGALSFPTAVSESSKVVIGLRKRYQCSVIKSTEKFSLLLRVGYL